MKLFIFVYFCFVIKLFFKDIHYRALNPNRANNLFDVLDENKPLFLSKSVWKKSRLDFIKNWNSPTYDKVTESEPYKYLNFRFEQVKDKEIQDIAINQAKQHLVKHINYYVQRANTLDDIAALLSIEKPKVIDSVEWFEIRS